MTIKKITGDFTVCKVADYTQVNLESEYCFIGKTDEERSLICLTEDVPSNTMEREDGWKAFRIEGVLDFSMIGVLSKIATFLAEEKIEIIAVSTFNTDYILVKKVREMDALSKLARAGYKISTGDGYGDYFLNRSADDIMSEYGDHEDEWVTLHSWNV